MTREEKIKNTYLGAHVSIQGGVVNAFKNAISIDANGFGMFVKNQRRWDANIGTCGAFFKGLLLCAFFAEFAFERVEAALQRCFGTRVVGNDSLFVVGISFRRVSRE